MYFYNIACLLCVSMCFLAILKLYYAYICDLTKACQPFETIPADYGGIVVPFHVSSQVSISSLYGEVFVCMWFPY